MLALIPRHVRYHCLITRTVRQYLIRYKDDDKDDDGHHRRRPCCCNMIAVVVKNKLKTLSWGDSYSCFYDDGCRHTHTHSEHRFPAPSSKLCQI